MWYKAIYADGATVELGASDEDLAVYFALQLEQEHGECLGIIVYDEDGEELHTIFFED